MSLFLVAFLSLLLFYSLLSTSLCAFKGSHAELKSFFDEELRDEMLQTFGIAAISVSVVSARATDSGVLFYGGYGLENPTQDIPVTNRSVFGIASISKTFVAISALQVFTDPGGKLLDLDTPIATAAPGLSKDVTDEIIGDYFRFVYLFYPYLA